MASVKFISTDYLKTNTAIDGNVDDKILEPFIIKAQNIHIQDALGSNLFDAYKTLITTGDIQLSGKTDYKTMLDDYINPALAEWSFYEALPWINYKITNQAVATKDSDNSTASSIDEVKWLRSSVRDSAEFYKQRLIKYMKESETLFSELQDEINCDDIKPNTNGYFNGLFLG